MGVLRQKGGEAEMVLQRRRGGLPQDGCRRPSGAPKGPQGFAHKGKDSSPHGGLFSGGPLRALCFSFGMGAALGVAFLCIFLTGKYLFSGRSHLNTSPVKVGYKEPPLRSRELRAVSPQGRRTAASWPLKEIDVKGLPALLLESQRKEEVFKGATEEFLHGKVGIDITGAPLWQPSPPPGEQTLEQLEDSFRGYCFNTVLSDSLSLDRPVPSFDTPACMEKREAFLSSLPPSLSSSSAAAAGGSGDRDGLDENDKAVTVPSRSLKGEMLTASVVLVFHNENLSVLLRSIHSVLNRTPPAFLKEVILVNDDSDVTTHPWLKTQLEDYVAMGLPKTKLLILKQRRGLMGARAAGAAIAKGEVVVFLDSHIEVLKYWLEPLLQRIRESPKTAALPRVASIDSETFEVVNGGIDTLAFSWNLGHMHRDDEIKGREINKHKREGDPIESPIMPGGIFAISKDWWNTLGGYDEGLRLYAGEEFELSFKVWMCGGRLEVLTCSKVAHVFRSDKYWKGQVYKVPGEEIARNKQRAAHVWMDRYVEYVLLTTPPVSRDFLGDLGPQRALREKLQCKSFQWYLDNVYPELEAPSLETAKTGALVREDIKACLDTMQEERGPLGAYPCHFAHGTQAFLFDGSTGRLFVGQKGFTSCVGGDPASRSVLQLKCTYTSDDAISMKWKYFPNTQQLQLLYNPPASTKKPQNRDAAAATEGESTAATEGAATEATEGEATEAAAAAPSLCMRLFAFPSALSPHAVELADCDPQDISQQLIFVP